MAAPVQRKGGSTRRPREPRVAPTQKKKGPFSPGVIATLLVLVLLGATAILVGSGAFSSKSAPTAAPSQSSTPSPSATPTTSESATAGSTAAATPSASPSATPPGTSSATSSATPLPTSSAAPTTVSSVNCTYTRSTGGIEKFTGLPPAKATTGARTATVVTNRGTIVVQLNAGAPCTVNSFAFLASKNYYDGTSCHRLLNAPGFTALQCGDATGSGGKGGPGYIYADENLAGATYPRGTLAMANAGPGTNGSQFFFVFKDSQFAPSYTPFGKVISGLDVIDAIAADGTDNGQSDGAPKKSVTLSSVRVK